MATLRVVVVESEFESGNLRAVLETALSAFGVAPASTVALSADTPAATQPAPSFPRELPAAGRAVEQEIHSDPEPKKKAAPPTPPQSGERKSLSELCREALRTGPKGTQEIVGYVSAAGSSASYQQVYGVLYNLSKNRRVERFDDDAGVTKWRLGK